MKFTALCCCAFIIATFAFPQVLAQRWSWSPCHLPADVGPCRASFRKYYYDSRSRNCRQFNYGGCGGNSNRFDNMQQCRGFRQECLRARG